MLKASTEPIEWLLRKNIFYISRSETIKKAAGLMHKHNIGCLLVKEGNLAVGLISEVDIVRRVMAKDLVPEKTKVEQVMSAPLITAPTDTSISDIYHKMAEYRIRHLILTCRGKEVGVISASSLSE